MPDDSPIAVGDKYPNYKALCKKLGLPVKTGDTKKNQIDYWQNCFLWERNKNAYIITKIIKPLDKRPHIQRENSKWYKNVNIIILNKIIDSLEHGVDHEFYNSLVLTSTEAYFALGLCNGKFSQLKSKSFSEIPLEHGTLFYSYATDKFYHILNNVLKSLQSQYIIHHVKTYRFSRVDEGNKVRLASRDELKFILTIVGGLLEKYKVQNEYNIILLHREAEFYEELNSLLYELGIKNCYKVHHISFTESSLPRFHEYKDSLETQTSSKLDINSKSCDDLFNEVNNICEPASKTFEDLLEISSNIRTLIDLTIPMIG